MSDFEVYRYAIHAMERIVAQDQSRIVAQAIKISKANNNKFVHLAYKATETLSLIEDIEKFCKM